MSNQIDANLIKKNIPNTGIFQGYEEFPSSAIVYAKEPLNKSLALDGYLFWNNIPVCYEGGVRLLVGDNNPLRASQVEFYIDDLDWTYAINSPRITSPSGDGNQAGEGWFAPGMLQFGILIFQANLWFGRVDPGINRMAIQHPEKDILINVNDIRGTYGDNGGAFDLFLKVLS
jgi:hypothetical protein